ncbi:hypothetical protein I4U23_020628 [Adineta vaga]|nr:hypothetical protein I4U23_020628 [Adineta vaga]
MLPPVPVVQPTIPVKIEPPSSLPLLPEQPVTSILWKTKFPTIFSSIICFLQYGITFIIIGCEIGSVLIDMVTATIYVGFWASIFFISACISQGVSSCCCRGRPCATFALINQCIALVFATCVIGFDAYFISYPTTCFFPSDVCSSSSNTRGVFFSTTNFYNVKIPLIKGQLAAGAVMFVLCLICIAIYIFTAMQVYRVSKPSTTYPPTQYTSTATAQNIPPVLPTGPDGLIIAPPLQNVRPRKPGSPLYHRPMIHLDTNDVHTNDLICPTCNSVMALTLHNKSSV